MSEFVNVIFPLLGKELQIKEHSKIADACAMIGVPLNQVCGGKGRCGKCAVEIRMNGKQERVLGCQVDVSEGLEIMISRDESEEKILTTNMIKKLDPNPSLKSYLLKKEELKTPLGDSDWLHICQVLNRQLEKPSLELLRKLSDLYHHEVGIELIVYGNTLVDVLPYADLPLYGLAFDVGTTTIVGHLYELKKYEQIALGSSMNKQISIGGDVISRIDYTINQETGLKQLNDLVIESINDVIEDICSKNGIDKNRIYQSNFCGNSTMQHLLLKLNPAYLGKMPFSSTIQESISARARDLNVKINPLGVITVLPIIGGHVGGDTSSVLLSIQNDQKNRLVIDLGTNGEVAVGSNLNYKVSSMASGPALEGYGLENGMRGTEGAIERVSIVADDLFYSVIGDVKPIGICGSGIIDLMAELLRHDIINETGAFADPSEIEAPKLSERLISAGKTKSFIVAHGSETENGKPIILTQKDVRQIQLAKAAIYTGCTMLLEESGINGEDLEEILMAGAFGNYINIDKAQYIGMIPYYKDVPVYSIGNAAATGSQLFLLSKEEEEECKNIAKRAIHIEIASNPHFNENFINNINLKKLERYE